MIRPDLRARLLAMAAEDARVREELAADGSLFDGYHPRMEAVHRENAEQLRAIIAQVGWPGRALAGDDGADAAGRILQHSIGEPEFLRHGLALLRAAAERGDADPVQAAMLEDRIRVFEGRGQLYGTQFDWDAGGQMSPCPIEDPDQVDERRRRLGLNPLAEHTESVRARVASSNERPPADHAARTREFEAWARRTGWR